MEEINTNGQKCFYYLISEGSYSDYGPMFMIAGPSELTESMITTLYQDIVRDQDKLREVYEDACKKFAEENNIGLFPPIKDRSSKEQNWGAQLIDWNNKWRAFYETAPLSPNLYDTEAPLLNGFAALGFVKVSYGEFNLDMLPIKDKITRKGESDEM